ncbi:hypothetical protein C8R46DRAFT_1037436 [Mycena filopes]|nr:hypothetical protein C8R46DRAFT_1037436 [Mycena filopes]
MSDPQAMTIGASLSSWLSSWLEFITEENNFDEHILDAAFKLIDGTKDSEIVQEQIRKYARPRGLNWKFMTEEIRTANAKAIQKDVNARVLSAADEGNLENVFTVFLSDPAPRKDDTTPDERVISPIPVFVNEWIQKLVHVSPDTVQSIHDNYGRLREMEAMFTVMKNMDKTEKKLEREQNRVVFEHVRWCLSMHDKEGSASNSKAGIGDESPEREESVTSQWRHHQDAVESVKTEIGAIDEEGKGEADKTVAESVKVDNSV